MNLIVCALLLFSSQVFAFTLNGSDPNMRGFQTSNLKFHLNSSNCPGDIESDISAAFDLWNSAPGSKLKLSLAGSTSTTASQLRLLSFPEDAVIACSTNFAADSSDSLGNNGCSGACLDVVVGVGVAVAISSSAIDIGYLILNLNSSALANYETKSSSTRRVILAHEMGHVLGLGHSGVSSALMFYDVSARSKLSLHQDDIDGISYLYPEEDYLGGCGMVKESSFLVGGQGLIPYCWMCLLLIPFLIGLIKRLRPPIDKKNPRRFPPLGTGLFGPPLTGPDQARKNSKKPWV